MSVTSGPNEVLGPNPEGALEMGRLITEAGKLADERISDDHQGYDMPSVWTVYDKAGFTTEVWEHVEATGTTPNEWELSDWLREECLQMILNDLQAEAEDQATERYIDHYEATHGVKYEG